MVERGVWVAEVGGSNPLTLILLRPEARRADRATRPRTASAHNPRPQALAQTPDLRETVERDVAGIPDKRLGDWLGSTAILKKCANWVVSGKTDRITLDAPPELGQNVS